MAALVLIVGCQVLCGQVGIIACSASGFRNTTGVARFELYASSKDFLNHKKATFSTTVALGPEPVKAQFQSVPFGEYAVAVFHDENKNGILDKNFIGMPLEGCGFTTPTKPKGPVAFNDARFVLNQATRLCAVQISYIFKK